MPLFSMRVWCPALSMQVMYDVKLCPRVIILNVSVMSTVCSWLAVARAMASMALRGRLGGGE